MLQICYSKVTIGGGGGHNTGHHHLCFSVDSTPPKVKVSFFILVLSFATDF